MVVLISRRPTNSGSELSRFRTRGAADQKITFANGEGAYYEADFAKCRLLMLATGGSVHQRRVATPRTFVALLGAVSLAGATLAAQSAAPKTKYVAPRAADGHADISGVWEHNAATP